MSTYQKKKKVRQNKVFCILKSLSCHETAEKQPHTNTSSNCRGNQHFKLSERTRYYVRPIHWTWSPATEATRNSLHLKQQVQTHVKRLWCHAFRGFSFTIISGSWNSASGPASAPKLSPINWRGGGRITGETLDPPFLWKLKRLCINYSQSVMSGAVWRRRWTCV